MIEFETHLAALVDVAPEAPDVTRVARRVAQRRTRRRLSAIAVAAVLVAVSVSGVVAAASSGTARRLHVGGSGPPPVPADQRLRVTMLDGSQLGISGPPGLGLTQLPVGVQRVARHRRPAALRRRPHAVGRARRARRGWARSSVVTRPTTVTSWWCPRRRSASTRSCSTATGCSWSRGATSSHRLGQVRVGDRREGDRRRLPRARARRSRVGRSDPPTRPTCSSAGRATAAARPTRSSGPTDTPPAARPRRRPSRTRRRVGRSPETTSEPNGATPTAHVRIAASDTNLADAAVQGLRVAVHGCRARGR